MIGVRCRRPQGARRAHRRLPGVDRVVGRSAAGLSPARDDRPGAGRRRRRARVLEGDARGVPRYPRAALLVPQASQCACCAAEIGAPCGARRQSRTSTTPRTSIRPKSRSRRSRSTTAPSTPRRSPRSSTTLIVLLEFYKYPAEHWIHLRTTNPIESNLRHRAVAHQGHQGPRIPRGGNCHGLQADRLPHRPVGGQSTRHTWSPWSVPAPSSTKANCSNVPVDITPTEPSESTETEVA